MPSRPRKPCMHGGCKAFALPGEAYCAAHLKLHQVSKNRHPPEVHRRYCSKRWRDVRAAVIAAHPLCVLCEQQGRIVPAAVVDHIMPHHGDTTLFWDVGNMQPLCKQCHDKKTMIEEGNARRSALGGRGGSISGE